MESGELCQISELGKTIKQLQTTGLSLNGIDEKSFQLWPNKGFSVFFRTTRYQVISAHFSQ